MTLSQAVAGTIEEILGSVELAPRNGFHCEPRCRVCRSDEMRTKVNDLLATGASYAYILRTLAAENGRLDVKDKVTIDSIRNHCARHFPVQNAARATYRVILEQRAKENAVDFAEGVATAITPMAFYETVMVKGYEALADPNTKVDVRTGMIAAGRLQEMIDSRSGRTSMADILVQLDHIISAIHSTVPKELWPEILRKIDGPVPAERPVDEYDDAQDMYDPMESANADEDCWTATGRRDLPVGRRHAPTRKREAPSSAMREFTPRTVNYEDEDGF